MRRNMTILAMMLLFVLGIAGFAISKGTVLTGKVVAVEGKKVTVQIEKGNPADAKVGTVIEMELKEDGKAKTPALEQMQGC